MRICIDVRPALSFATGVGVYVENLVRALAEIDKENEYDLFSSSWKKRFPGVVYGKNFHIRDHRWPVRILNYSWNHFSRPPIEWFLGDAVDVVHSPTPMQMPARRARRITTVHDLYFYFHPDQTVREMRSDYPAFLQAHCSKSDAIIAISEYTKQQLVEHLKIPSSRVYTIRHGGDTFYAGRVSPEELDRVKSKFGIKRPYFLFVGAPEPRKNLPVLLEAFQGLQEDVELVLAGPNGRQSEARTSSLNRHVILTGYVVKSDLRALYQQAIALVLPSIDEGFGLPMLEAMASETAIIASQISAFKEIGNDSFLAVDALDVEQLREAMRKVYSDSELRKSLIASGRERFKKFTWEETARKTLELYKNL